MKEYTFFLVGKFINAFPSTTSANDQTLKEAAQGYVGLLGL
jgi:hypothetical protein